MQTYNFSLLVVSGSGWTQYVGTLVTRAKATAPTSPRPPSEQRGEGRDACTPSPEGVWKACATQQSFTITPLITDVAGLGGKQKRTEHFSCFLNESMGGARAGEQFRWERMLGQDRIDAEGRWGRPGDQGQSLRGAATIGRNLAGWLAGWLGQCLDQ